MIPSLDMVEKNNWLICTRGPEKRTFNGMGELITYIDKGFEGGLFKVIALNPPFVFGEMHYPLDLHQPPQSRTIQMGGDGAQWDFANPKYVRAYLNYGRKHAKTMGTRDSFFTDRER